MAVGSYKTLGEAMAAFQVTGIREDFIQPKPFTPRDFFRPVLQASLEECPGDCSEWAVCENLIYPVLREVGRTYAKTPGGLESCVALPRWRTVRGPGLPG